MGEAIGGVLPSAVGVALSPVPIVAVVLLLATPRARTNGPAFGLGWIVGLVVVSVVVLVLTGGADTSTSAADGTSTAKVVCGVLLLVLGVRQWRKRPAPGADPDLPAWMATLDDLGVVKAAGLGAALSGVNPKNLVLTAAAAASISESGASTGEAAAAVAVFTVIASLTVVGPVAAYLAAGERAQAALDRLRTTMAAHNAVIMAVICWLIGAKLIGDGTGRLSG